MYSTFLGGAIGLTFDFLLIMWLKGSSVGVILCFDGKNSDCFYALKILVNALILSLDKNISIRDAKSA